MQRGMILSEFRRTHHPEASTAPPLLRRAPYGRRQDGTPKGRGYLGFLRGPDNSVKTEYTIGVNIDGQDMDIPTLVPTLTKKQRETMAALKPGEEIPKGVVKKAVAHARQRRKLGLSAFYD